MTKERETSRSPEEVKEAILARFRDEVDQANVVLEWAISAAKTAKLEKLKDSGLIGRIKVGMDLLTAGEPDSSKRADFETAYNELMAITSPVTWETLQATTSKYGAKTLLAPIRYIKGRRLSQARTWSRTLWIWTTVLLVLIVVGENLPEYLDIFAPTEEDAVAGGATGFARATFWFSKIVPFLYGALGACAFLLRSCHKFIHERTFDPRRLPEYYSRILLGFLAGGTILLFINPESAPQKIGATALAFLAGYIGDFLYTTIERVAGALLPKKTADEELAAEAAADKK